ncbi:DUF3267 domain-containing protein [Spirosoma utsteinense]|uniref:DUF3267 domain-containing protein n=1 Tax=Spirosoma utsteinense TaxID=2585773 RepID=A0ABR6WB89_9BACT|nr:DUF3267 domain-containing protein [Spirosoma utsteinense]MBC3786807.1 hypothetical protein [Spirosoma utsteinense]MBC3793772.1 hypothetical protein [Spirosoma utsteinense]
MRPTVEQLHTSGQYILLESFKIDEMSQFLMRELGMVKKPNPEPQKQRTGSWIFLVGLTLAGGAFGYAGGKLLKGNAGVDSFLWQVGAGVLALFLLLPIHEFIHGLAFKRIGAPNVGYGYSLRSMMVYAYCQKFPTTMREVAFVAVLPFVLITAGLITAWIVWPTYGVFWAMLLLMHTSGCIGDFVLINYYIKTRHRRVYTYDDVEGERMTYFFEERG